MASSGDSMPTEHRTAGRALLRLLVPTVALAAVIGGTGWAVTSAPPGDAPIATAHSIAPSGADTARTVSAIEGLADGPGDEGSPGDDGTPGAGSSDDGD